MIKFSPTTSIKFLPCLQTAICCIENHLTTSDWVMISFSYMAFILVNIRELLYSYSLIIMSQEEAAPEASKLRVTISKSLKYWPVFIPQKFWWSFQSLKSLRHGSLRKLNSTKLLQACGSSIFTGCEPFYTYSPHTIQTDCRAWLIVFLPYTVISV